MVRDVESLAPASLGRSIVVAPGSDVPAPWSDVPRVLITPGLLSDQPELARIVDRLHRAWVAREPVVVELGVEPAVLREPETSAMDPWRLRRGFSFLRERLHHLVWANSYDYRSGELIWWWGRKAEALGAVVDETADIRLADGRLAWVDGGPRGPILNSDDVVIHAETITIGRLTPASQGGEATPDG